MSAPRGRLAVLLGLVAIVAIAVVVWSQGGDGAEEPAQALVPTPRRPLLSPLLTPTVETVSGAETTLLEVATGRKFEWPASSEVQNPRFSADGRWLVYNAGWLPDRGQDPNAASVYRIDLQAALLAPENLGPGFNPVISMRGDIAYVSDVEGQVANVYVRSADGKVHRLKLPGSTFLAPKWAPDGSYLVYAGGSNQPTAGIPGGTPVILTDSATWTARIIDYGGASTHGLVIDVSPDGRYVLHGSSRIVTVATGAVQEARFAQGWLDATHYLYRDYQAQAPQNAILYSVDVDTGERVRLVESQSPYWNLHLGLIATTVQEDVNPSQPGGPVDQYVRLTRFDGSVVADRLPGAFGGWAPDNRYLTTLGADSKCQPTIYDLTGKELACFNAAAISWGPPDLIALLKVTRPAEPGPKVATGDVYLHDLATGAERRLLTGLRWGAGGPCLRWSPDWRWLVADDYCDTI